MREHERHLTEEMLLHVQMGDPASEAERAHLESCAECRQQVEPLSDALRWFGAAAREFGAERAAMPRSARVVAHTWSGLSWGRSWGLGRGLAAACCVLLILLAVAIPRWQQHRAAAAARVEQQRQQQLTEDDALLEEVDQDVSQEVPEAMQPLSLNSSSTTAGTGGTRGNAVTRQ